MKQYVVTIQNQNDKPVGSKFDTLEEANNAMSVHYGTTLASILKTPNSFIIDKLFLSEDSARLHWRTEDEEFNANWNIIEIYEEEPATRAIIITEYIEQNEWNHLTNAVIVTSLLSEVQKKLKEYYNQYASAIQNNPRVEGEITTWNLDNQWKFSYNEKNPNGETVTHIVKCILGDVIDE